MTEVDKYEKGVEHYTADGKLWSGPTHKDASGRLMTGAEHGEDSEYLYHKEDLAVIGPRGGINKSPKAPKSSTPNKNPEGRGTSKGDSSTTRGSEVPKAVEEALQKKVDEFNEKYKEKLGYGVNVGMLKTVYQRGVGAFTTSHSPRVTSSQQWAYARVNAFLYIVKNGRPENPKYVNDNDLLPKKHKKNSDGKKDMSLGATASSYDFPPANIEFESYKDYPRAARENAQTALDWAEKNGWGSCGTDVGKQRANQLAKGEPISEETIARMASFERQRQNSNRKLGEGCGRLMWLAWGGDEGVEWASRKLKQIRRQDLTENFKSQRKVIFNEDFDDASVISYIEKGFKVHIRSSRKIHKRDKKVWNKLRSVGLTEDVMVFGEVKDLDKRYEYDLLMTGQDPILEKLKLMGEDGSKYKVLSSKRIDSMSDAFAAETELIKSVDLKFITIKVKYTYEEIEGIPKAASGSRPFCSGLRSTPTRMWSLEEINRLPKDHLVDMDLPDDIFQYRGGFYRNPTSGVTTAFCRHYWKVNVVVDR